MLVAFLIMLREGIEAALIVGIVASFLKQGGNGHLLPKVWMGVALAMLACLAGGYLIHRGTGELPQRQQEIAEAVIGLIAVGMLTWMIMWMQKAARSLKGHLQDSVQGALQKGGWALVGMAFLAVAREGLESAFFLLAIFQQSQGWGMPVGALLGIAVSIVLGYMIYQGGIRLNLRRFFRVTGVFLIVVAAGLLSSAVRSLHEAGLWNGLQSTVFNSRSVLHEDSPLGVVLSGMLGYTDHPSLSQVLVWLAYVMIALYLFLRPQSSQTSAIKAA